MTKTTAILGALFFSTALKAEPQDMAPSCPAPDYEQNLWALTVNSDDLSDKDSLLETFDVLHKGGFSVALSQRIGQRPERYLLIKFDSASYKDARKAETVRTKTLETLADQPGNQLECVATRGTIGSMGVRN